jgi:outer membrane protein assembly factor BamB
VRNLIFVGSRDEVSAYRIGGGKLWSRVIGNGVIEDLKIRDNTQLVINNDNIEIFCIDQRDGSTLWKLDPNGTIASEGHGTVFDGKLLLDERGDIYVFYNRGYLARLRGNGQVLGQWQVLETGFTDVPALTKDGYMYLIDEKFNLQSIRLVKDKDDKERR